MNPQLLIDAIVRQTTVLIARVSTVGGVRSPLGHVANEVFVGLVAELDNQGVSKKVIADMFGMALRAYRQKVQRLGESVPSRGLTLWTAVQRFLSERESATRIELLEQFHFNDEASVRGVLNDLVHSGLLVLSGRGDDARYRVPTEEELRDLGTVADSKSQESQAALAWVHIYRDGPITLDRLGQLLPLSRQALEAAVDILATDGRIKRELRDGQQWLSTAHILISLGQTEGWEAAIVDHHRAVLNAIAAKLSGGTRGSTAADEVGGTTLTFDLWPGHPRENDVRALLSATRSRVIPLWDEVEAYNRDHAGKETYQVHFYCGQYLVEEEPET